MSNELAKVLRYYNLIPEISSSFKIVCPFHEDVNPSMIVDLDENSWYCFGCNLHGDAVKFVYYMENLNSRTNDLQSYLKYLRILKSDKCSDVKLNLRRSKKIKPRRDLYNQAYDYYNGLKKIIWTKNRASEEQEIKEVRKYMIKRGFYPDTLEKAKAKITYNKSYPIIFPMLDNGKFKGWVCRTNSKEIEKKRKYLYNEGFSRATTLVGNYGSKDYVFAVEGYMDRLKFVQFGEENVVAILGWKMSQQQIQKLKEKGVKTIISALDNDECGKKGTKYLQKHFNVIRYRYLKGIKDPGDMTKETFEKTYSKTMSIFKEEK